MSDVDSYLPTPKSPTEGEEPITLTDEQIQHVTVSSLLSSVENHTNTVRKEHRRIQAVDYAFGAVRIEYVHHA